MNIVSRSWSRPVTGLPNFVWEQKLKFTKLSLKEWVKQTLKFPSSDRIEVLKNLEEIQKEMDEAGITPAKLEKEQQAQFNAFCAFRKEEEYWSAASG